MTRFAQEGAYASRRGVRDRADSRSGRVVLLAGLAVCLTISLGAFADFGEDAATSRPAPARKGPDQVNAVLLRVKDQWARRDIGRLVPSALGRDDFRPVLERILANPSDPMFESAVIMAVHFKIADLAPPMQSAMRVVGDETQALLVGAIEALEPWQEEHVVDLLYAQAPGVRVAALGVLGKREKSAEILGDMASMLASPEANVRAAALASLPSSLPTAVGEQIAAAQQSLSGEEAAEAILALGRCIGSQIVDDVLYRRLDDQEYCDFALRALASRPLRLEQPGRVLAVAVDASRPMPTRARALLCLDVTGTAVPARSLEAMALEHPVLQYLAARAMLRTHDARSLPALLELARIEPSAAEGDERRLLTEVRMGARQLLAQLSGTSVYVEASAWAAWVGQKPRLVATSLPPPTVHLDG